jgi:hypothetical protein
MVPQGDRNPWIGLRFRRFEGLPPHWQEGNAGVRNAECREVEGGRLSEHAGVLRPALLEGEGAADQFWEQTPIGKPK